MGNFVWDNDIGGENGIQGGDWSSLTAWNPTGVPDMVGDNAQLPPGDYGVTVATSEIFTIGSLEIDGGGLTVAGTLTATTLAVFGGGLEVDGLLSIGSLDDGAVTIRGILEITGSETFNSQLLVDGTLDLTGQDSGGGIALNGGVVLAQDYSIGIGTPSNGQYLNGNGIVAASTFSFNDGAINQTSGTLQISTEDFTSLSNGTLTDAFISIGNSGGSAATVIISAPGVIVSDGADIDLGTNSVFEMVDPTTGSITTLGDSLQYITAGGTLLVGTPFIGNDLTVDGVLTSDNSMSLATLVIDPSGTLHASGQISGGEITLNGLIEGEGGGSTLTFTGPVTNLVAGTLTGGDYITQGDTLEFGSEISVFGAVAEVAGIAHGDIESFDSASGSEAALETTLTRVAAGGDLQYVNSATAANVITVDGILESRVSALTGPGLTVDTGGTLLTEFGTIAEDVVNNGLVATDTDYGSGINQSSGKISGSISGSGTVTVGNGTGVLGNATLELGAGMSETLFLVGPNNLLMLDSPGSVTGEIIGFSGTVGTHHGDTIDLSGFTSLTDAYNGTTAGGTLTLSSSSGNVVADLDFNGSYTLGDFSLTQTGTSTFLTTDIVPCFCRGTMILTDQDEVAVECLQIGDRVVTQSGSRPIRWIGERRVDCGSHPRPELVEPIRVRAQAFGRGLPLRDLLLSPDHSLFVDGVLIPVRHLVNGATVVRERVGSTHYYHVELSAHDVLFAEGLAAESYLDTGNRSSFANGGAATALHPDFAPLGWDDACAELCQSGPVVAAVRARLTKRAWMMGYRRAGGRPPELVVGTRTIRASTCVGDIYRFLLPANTGKVCVVSGVGVPAANQASSDDCRQLGVAIGGVFLNGRPLGLTSEAFGRGFHALEACSGAARRWTDGYADLVLPRQASPGVLDLRVLETMAGWVLREVPGLRVNTGNSARGPFPSELRSSEDGHPTVIHPGADRSRQRWERKPFWGYALERAG